MQSRRITPREVLRPWRIGRLPQEIAEWHSPLTADDVRECLAHQGIEDPELLFPPAPSKRREPPA